MNDWAEPGAKCVCIKSYRHESLLQELFAPNIPVRRGVYTVRSCQIASNTGALCLTFEEFSNPPYVDGTEVGFGADGFRPLITRSLEQDLALFAPADARVPETV